MTQFNADQIIASPYGKFAQESARLAGNVPRQQVPAKSRQLQDAFSLAQARARGRGQTMTPGMGPGGVSPVQAGVEAARKVVNENYDLNDAEQEEAGQLDPNMPIQQYEGLVKGMKKRPQKYQAAGQEGPRGTISIAPGTDKNAVSAEEFAKGQARVKAGLAPGEQMVSDVSDDAEGAVPGYTVSTPGAAAQQNPTSMLIDAFKDKASPEALEQAKAALGAGITPEQVFNHLTGDVRNQQALKAHTDAMTSRIGQQHMGRLERDLKTNNAELLKYQSMMEMAGDPNSPEGKEAQAKIDTLQQQISEDQAEYNDMRGHENGGTSQQQPTNGKQPAGEQGQPPRVNTPEDAAKLPPGTQFMTPDGQLRVRH